MCSRSLGTAVDMSIHRVTSDNDLAKDILMSLPGVDLSSDVFEGNFDRGFCEVAFSCKSAFSACDYIEKRTESRQGNECKSVSE